MIGDLQIHEIILLALMLIFSFLPLYNYLSHKKQNIRKFITAYKYASIRGPIFFLIALTLFFAGLHVLIVLFIYIILYLYNFSLFRRSLDSHRYYKKQDEDTIYIFNGDYVYLNFKEHFIGKQSIVFNEALVLGDISKEFLSPEFIERRIEFLSKINHDEDINVKYDKFVNDMLTLTKVDTYHKVELYFDEDMFCQINLLAILHYLKANGFQGKINLHYITLEIGEGVIDDYIIKTIRIDKEELSLLSNIYLNVSKNTLDVVPSARFRAKFNVIIKGIDLYLDLINKPDKMKEHIYQVYQDNECNKKKTIKTLLKQMVDYGLPDIFYENILNEFN